LIPICRNGLSGRVLYHREFADPGTYRQLKDLLLKVDKDHATTGIISTISPPRLISSAPSCSNYPPRASAKEENHQWRRVIVENHLAAT
jgi:hypothetical protein